MIQRIQSLYMLAGFILAIALFFVPVASFDMTGGETFTFTIIDFQALLKMELERQVFITPFITNILAAAILVVNIFLYKNRKLQRRLLMVTVVVNLSTLGGLFYLADQIQSLPEVISRASYMSGIYFPLAILLFLVLANKGIRKDEKLLRSADRLR
ncbi:MAG: DUF4293 domain-containing protein [Bacteroidales bacterium]